MKHRFLPAFTIVELMVVVTIIGILASISVVGSTSIQRSTRDSARSSQTTIVADALEKYYDANQEYPSVASIAGQPIATVKSKLKINSTEVLVFPTGASNTSALVSATPSPTRLAYTASTIVAANDAQCQSSATGYCDAFRLQYLKESDGAITTVASRQNPSVVVVPPDFPSAPTQPAVSGAKLSSTQVRFTASSATCALGSVEYKIVYSTTSTLPAWSTVSWSSVTTKDVNPGSNTTYYSQSLARCVNGADVSADSTPSAVDVLDFSPPPPANTAPGNPSVSASGTSVSTVSVSWAAVSGTTPITYTVSYGTSTAYGSTACSAISGTSCSISGLAAGTTYYIRVVATNAYGTGTGTSAATTSTGATCNAPTTPSGLYTSSATTSSMYLNWNYSSGDATITYYVYYGTSAGTATSTYKGATTSNNMYFSGLSASTTYYFQIYASNCNSSGYSAVANGTTSGAACSAPSGLSASSSAGSSSSVQLSWSLPTPGCTPISYSVSGSGTTSSCSSTGTSCNVTGLSMSTQYTFTVTATNSAGSNSSSTTVTTSPPTLSASSGDMTKYGNSTTSFTVSGLTGSAATTNTSYTVSYCGPVSVYGNGSGSCTFDHDPCKFNKTATVSGNGLSDSATITAFSGAAPGINLGGSTVNGNKTVTLNWSYSGLISWVQIKKQKNSESPTYVDYISEGSGGSGSWTSDVLGSASWTFTIAAANCLYRAPWSFGGTNYNTANTSSTTKNVP